MLKQVQHDMVSKASCHPEPGPELDSGSIEFGILVLILIISFPWKDKTPVFAPEEGSDDGEDQGSEDETGK
jgi:hypothetical protein